MPPRTLLDLLSNIENPKDTLSDKADSTLENGNVNSLPIPLDTKKNILVVNLPNKVPLELIYIPGGIFKMGSLPEEQDREDQKGLKTRETPQHDVNVPAFYMGKYPVTQAQWHAISLLERKDIPLSPLPSRFRGDSLPVERVSWYESVEFCKRLSDYTHCQYRLPSEAEWEYACRAKTTTPFSFGKRLTKIWGKKANFNHSKTTPVGQYPGNDLGLYDMHGNVWEWCLDDWHETYDGAPTDGSAWLDNTAKQKERVRRGGSWYDTAWVCRSAYRTSYLPVFQFGNLGFRVVLTLQ